MIDLSNTTFIIPIKIDSKDRLRNYNIIIEYLTKEFDTNIMVCESDQVSHEELLKITDNIKYFFVKNDTHIFHRTHILNYMTKMCETDIVCNYDTDVLFPVKQYTDALELIKKGNTIVFPYGGKFLNVHEEFFPLLKSKKFNDIDESKLELAHPQSLGGAFFFDKEKYGSIGWENENFVSWGFEDNERINRLVKLGHTWSRTEGPLYHLNHSRTLNSAPNHPFYTQNMKEFNKINSMSPQQLKDYISSWGWIN